MINRAIKPTVINTPDTPNVQFRCDPQTDDINIDQLLAIILARFEFTLGTSFDLQFLTLDGKQIVAMQRYLVTRVIEDIETTDVNHYQTLTRLTHRRDCNPISEMYIFDESANSLRGHSEQQDASEIVDIDAMSVSELQSAMKSITGKGFRAGTTKEQMVEAVREHL